MSEKLIIKNFGPIKEVELDLRKFNVLIGEQATGKSTVAKLLAICRYFSYLVEDDILLKNSFEEGLIAWGLEEAIQLDSYIFYECEHYTFTAQRELTKEYDREQEDGNVIEIEYYKFSPKLEAKSKEFENLLEELEKLKPPNPIYSSIFLDWNIPTSFFQNDVEAVMDNPFYLRTERGLQSIFSLGKQSIPNISDSLYNHLAKISQIAGSFKKDTNIEPLGISFKNDNGKGYIKKNVENDFFSLSNAASGYQSAIPIVLATKFYSDIRTRGKTFIIEEPELNLFPIAQYSLMQYLVNNSTFYGNPFLLTTHSPYILTSLNNLMYAYEVGTSKPDKVNEIIKKQYWINPEDVSAYRLLTDGTCRKIISKSEDGTLIAAEEIDEVSSILNKEFNDLINIELGVKNEEN